MMANEDVRETTRAALTKFLSVTDDPEVLAIVVLDAIEAHGYRVIHPDWTTGTIREVLHGTRRT